MLAYLLLNSARLVTIERLGDAIWGLSAPASARSQIHSTAYIIRRHLRAAGSAATLVGQAGGYQLDLGGDELDLVCFDGYVARARADSAEQRWEAAARQLRVALDLWRGDALADASGAFVEGSRLSLRDRQLGAVEALVECQIKLGGHAQILPDLRDLVARHPQHEKFREHLMLALYLDGRRDEALEQFQRLRVSLADKQGLDPGAPLVALHKAILAGEDLRPAPDRIEAHPQPRATAWQPPAPAQLPPRATEFLGRDEELGVLDRVLRAGPRVAVIVGGAGVGKTALAVHWAGLRADLAPDGQLFVDLHGFGPREPLTSELALERLLRGLGVPAPEIPVGPDERSALYRSLLAGREFLVVLDNARDSEQVRPLIAVGGSMTVVTSRRRLDGLVVYEDAAVLALPPLDADHGRLLLSTLTGHDLADPAIVRLADLCDQLPLALRVAAARLLASRHMSAGDLVAALADEHERLSGLTVEEGGVTVRAAFRLSYQALSGPAAQLFRLLGRFPGPVPTAASCAAMAGRPVAALLDELVAMHLVVSTGHDRFALHDLLLLYARGLAADDLPEIRAAERRLLDFYGTAAATGAALLRPDAKSFEPEIAGTVREPVVLPDADAALDWFDAESPNLIALIQQWTTRQAGACWRLAANLAGWLERRASRTTWVEVMRAALLAARADGSAEGEAQVLNSLAIAHGHLRETDAALDAFRRSRQLREKLGDRYSAAVVTMNIGCLLAETGETAEALDALEAALQAFSVMPEAAIATRATRLNLAYVYRKAGRYGEALAVNSAVLDDAVAAGDDNLACNAHVNIGALRRLTGDLDEALRHYRLALLIARDLRYQTYEKWALRGLGAVHLDQHRYRDAATHLSEAVMLYRNSDDPATEEVQKELESAFARGRYGAG
jgi:DNA-binding SARP family transcriptional activator